MEVLMGKFNVEGDQERVNEFLGLRESLSFAENYFKNLEAFKPVSSMKSRYKNLAHVLRDIEVNIDRTNIIYLVTDNFFSLKEKKYFPLRLKGFFQQAGKEDISEVQDSAYQFMIEKYGLKIDMDLVE